MRLCSPGYGLSGALSRGSRACDGAELATSKAKAPTAAAPSPLGTRRKESCGTANAQSGQ